MTVLYFVLILSPSFQIPGSWIQSFRGGDFHSLQIESQRGISIDSRLQLSFRLLWLSSTTCFNWASLVVYVRMAKNSGGILGFAACRTLSSLRSPRRLSRLRFPVRGTARRDCMIYFLQYFCSEQNSSKSTVSIKWRLTMMFTFQIQSSIFDCLGAKSVF